MKRTVTLALTIAVVATSLFAAAVAGAGTKSAKTKLEVETVAAVGDEGKIYVLGGLESTDPACVGNRKVKIELLPDNGKPVLLDTARSSEIGGGWMGSAPIDDVIDGGPYSAARVKAAKTTRRQGKHKRVACKAAKVLYPLTD